MSTPVATLNAGTICILQERERALSGVLRKAGFRNLEGVKLFDAGCGTGYSLRQFVQWGAHPKDLAGIDIDNTRIEYARSHAPAIRVHGGSAESIPEPDKSFDVCFAARLFSSLHNEDAAERIALEMFRITRPGGLIVVYDIRRKQPGNPAIQSVDADDIRRWFPKCRAKTRHLTLPSTLAGILGRIGPAAYGTVGLVPPVRTHSLHVMRRPATSPFGDEGWEAGESR
jgi:SAM-dependent methyltransferase